VLFGLIAAMAGRIWVDTATFGAVILYQILGWNSVEQ
jgi:hypothetical protein